ERLISRIAPMENSKLVIWGAVIVAGIVLAVGIGDDAPDRSQEITDVGESWRHATSATARITARDVVDGPAASTNSGIEIPIEPNAVAVLVVDGESERSARWDELSPRARIAAARRDLEDALASM